MQSEHNGDSVHLLSELAAQLEPQQPGDNAGNASFYLMGLRLDGRSEEPNFYTFLIEQGGQMFPLAVEKQVIFFTRPDMASRALNLAGMDVEFRSLAVYAVDIFQTLYLLQSESADEQKIIANTLAFFASVLTPLGVPVPGVFADTLMTLGEYVDQNTFYGDFIERKEMTRARAIDAARWCLGTIFSIGRFITE